jgi:hypothetical protein
MMATMDGAEGALHRAFHTTVTREAAMSAKTELLKEARRCAYEASRGVSPAMMRGLSKFYGSLAESEPQQGSERREPAHRRKKSSEEK